MRDNRQNVTIKEVAERAGVSLMTVSRVMNNNGIVKPATRERVQKAMADLNYRPNISARRLAGGKSLFIGLIYHNPSPGYLSKILLGSLEACRKGGHSLVLEDFGNKLPYREPAKSAYSLLSVGLDGVIITPPLSNHAPFVEAIEALDIPVVQVAPMDIHTPELRVAMDDVQAAEHMLDHLVAHGHERIAFIKGQSDHPSTHHRFQGFEKGSDKHGLVTPPEYIAQGDFTYRSGLDAGRDLLALDNPPSAIFASNDDMAAGVVAAAYMRGLHVPDDISVVGFDDTEIATNIWPALTTIRQPISEMAARAVNLLTAHIRDDQSSVNEYREILDYELIGRHTVCKPRTDTQAKAR